VVSLAGGEPEVACHCAPWRGGAARRGQLYSGNGGASGVAHVTVKRMTARGGVATATAAAALCRSQERRRPARCLTSGLRGF
jgi:hypothetical protein